MQIVMDSEHTGSGLRVGYDSSDLCLYILCKNCDQVLVYESRRSFCSICNWDYSPNFSDTSASIESVTVDAWLVAWTELLDVRVVIS